MAQATRGTPGSLDFGTRTSPSLPAFVAECAASVPPLMKRTTDPSDCGAGRGGGGADGRW